MQQWDLPDTKANRAQAAWELATRLVRPHGFDFNVPQEPLVIEFECGEVWRAEIMSASSDNKGESVNRFGVDLELEFTGEEG